MKAFFSALCLLCLLGSVSAADFFMGKRISAPMNTSCDDEFNAILMTWTQDVQRSRRNGELSVCSNAEISAVGHAVKNAVFAARRAFNAQMEFARYSLEPPRESKPELHFAAELQFRQALQVLLKFDESSPYLPAGKPHQQAKRIDFACHRLNREIC